MTESPPPRTPLSKKSLLAGLGCDKHIHLLFHHPELADKTVTPAMVTGRVVGEHARSCFPGGIQVVRFVPGADCIGETQSLLRNPDVGVIFEAGLAAAGVEVFVDVLERTEHGWNLIEVKSSTAVKDEHLDDVTIQAWVAERAGLALHRVELMHINPDFVYPGGDNYAGLFRRDDSTERVRRHLPFIDAQIARLKTVVGGSQPSAHLGRQCKTPYVCEYFAHCAAQEPRYPVINLPRGGKTIDVLLARGIYDIRDIPPEMLTSDTQQRVRKVTIQGRPELRPGAARILTSLSYPRYYLDFECIQFAIPIWPGTRPYDQHPFQWSCHVQRADGSVEHAEFLDITGADPRRGFAESVLRACCDHGPVIVYNAAFEKRILGRLATLLPDLACALNALIARVFDLLPVVNQHYYHPDMKGSWSIKNVLPCLVPELNYKALSNVRDGTQAQDAYLNVIGGKLDAAHEAALRDDLRRYCEMDTLAMVKIVEHLSR